MGWVGGHALAPWPLWPHMTSLLAVRSGVGEVVAWTGMTGDVGRGMTGDVSQAGSIRGYLMALLGFGVDDHWRVGEVAPTQLAMGYLPHCCARIAADILKTDVVPSTGVAVPKKRMKH
eukprot:6457104-Amphidinium_carterae.1